MSSKNHMIRFSAMLLLVVFIAAGLASCATNRKCNGKKGIRTNMGRM